MGQILAVGNLKGGTGKSTICVNLAGALSATGRRVAVLDIDPQATATEWLASRKVDVDCQHWASTQVEQTEQWVQAAQAARTANDVVLLDLPALSSSVFVAAAMVAACVIVPVGCSGADVSATEKTLRLLRRVRSARGARRPACLIVPNRVDRRTAMARGLGEWLAMLGEPVAPPISSRIAHVEAIAAGEWVGGRGRHDQASAEILALLPFLEPLIGSVSAPLALAS